MTGQATVQISNGVGFRTFDAYTPSAQTDYAPGQTILLTVYQSFSGVGAPPEAESLQVRLVDVLSGTTIRTITCNTTLIEQTFNIALTSDGTPTGSPRNGMLEIVLRATRTTIPTYDGESDGSPNSSMSSSKRGWIRSTTAVSLASNLASAAYAETISLTGTLSHPLFSSQPLTIALGPSSGASNSATNGHVRNIPVSSVFPAGVNTYTPSLTPPTIAFAGVPYFSVTSTTAPSVTVDPRLTVDLHFQVDNDVYDPAGHRMEQSMLTAESGFLFPKITNAKGAPVSGVVGTQTLDPLKPGTTIGPVGFTTGADGVGLPKLDWAASKPGGQWDWTVAVSTPSGYTASYLIGENDSVVMLAPYPNYAVICGGGSTVQGRHFCQGDDLFLGAGLINGTTGQLLNTSGNPNVIIARFTDTGLVEYLDNTYSWNILSGSENAYGHILYPATTYIPGADSRVWLLLLPASIGIDWGQKAISLLYEMMDEAGTPYLGQVSLFVSAGKNKHDSQAFDPTGLFK